MVSHKALIDAAESFDLHEYDEANRGCDLRMLAAEVTETVDMHILALDAVMTAYTVQYGTSSVHTSLSSTGTVTLPLRMQYCWLRCWPRHNSHSRNDTTYFRVQNWHYHTQKGKALVPASTVSFPDCVLANLSYSLSLTLQLNSCDCLRSALFISTWSKWWLILSMFTPFDASE